MLDINNMNTDNATQTCNKLAVGCRVNMHFHSFLSLQDKKDKVILFAQLEEPIPSRRVC